MVTQVHKATGHQKNEYPLFALPEIVFRHQ